jgi:hypothetical protein
MLESNKESKNLNLSDLESGRWKHLGEDTGIGKSELSEKGSIP